MYWFLNLLVNYLILINILKTELHGEKSIYILSNLGVWLSRVYLYGITGLVNFYVAIIPFFKNIVLSTIICSSIIEMLLKHLRLDKF